MKLTVAPLTPDRWPDLEAIFNAKGLLSSSRLLVHGLPIQRLTRAVTAGNVPGSGESRRTQGAR